MNFTNKFLLVFLICHIKAVVGARKGWWKHTTIYEVYVWSFKDSDGDGIGDIKGLTSMLDHFVDIGVGTIWLSPIYTSPMFDFGYDVSDYMKIDPIFGTMEDFDELIEEMEERGLKLIMDFVFNHSSDEHQWFQKSVEKIEPYTTYYVWRNAKSYDENGKPAPPNNWLSVFGGSAWQWNEKRKQFYYHKFGVKQPDLNLRRPAVKEEINNITKFWLDKGASGGRLAAVGCYMEDPKLRDEPLKSSAKAKTVLNYNDYHHNYTTDREDTYKYVRRLRKNIDSIYGSDDNEKILISETHTDLNHTMMYYGSEDHPRSHLSSNLLFTKLKMFPNPKTFDKMIKDWLTKMPAGSVANWMTENHDNYRIGSRLNPQFGDIMLIVTMTLPGVAYIYYGQEIGMINNKVRPDQFRDPHNLKPDSGFQPRDSERLPMQWDDSMNAGFSSNVKTWLPVNSNYWRVNVETQKSEPNSRYNMFKTLSKLRLMETLKHGDFKSYIITSWIYAFSRSLAGEQIVYVVINFGTETEIVYLHHNIPNLPNFLKVLAASINAGYTRGKKIRTNLQFPQTFIMRPLSAVVFSS